MKKIYIKNNYKIKMESNIINLNFSHKYLKFNHITSTLIINNLDGRTIYFYFNFYILIPKHEKNK